MWERIMTEKGKYHLKMVKYLGMAIVIGQLSCLLE